MTGCDSGKSTEENYLTRRNTDEPNGMNNAIDSIYQAFSDNGKHETSHIHVQNRQKCNQLCPVIEQELGAIYLLEMTKCLTGIIGKGLPWNIQNRTS